MKKVIVILGPTASGKTALGVTLARALNGEVISADSRQVYRGLDVGTGKVTKKEMSGVPHHLLSIANPKNSYSASEYVTGGRKAISEIDSRSKVPIIVGGTGFYIDALLGTITLPEVQPNKKLRAELGSKKLPWLQKRLLKLDSARYAEIDIKNPVRLIRAIEIATALGRVPKTNSEKMYDVLYIGLSVPTDELRKKIHIRLFARIRGIEKEVKNLHAGGLSWKRMEELGLEYRYVARYVRGQLSKAEMLRDLESEIVKYAKRQMTWFKRNPQILWMKPSDERRATTKSRTFLSLRKRAV